MFPARSSLPTTSSDPGTIEAQIGQQFRPLTVLHEFVGDPQPDQMMG
jgi:hypothetical protein